MLSPNSMVKPSTMHEAVSWSATRIEVVLFHSFNDQIFFLIIKVVSQGITNCLQNPLTRPIFSNQCTTLTQEINGKYNVSLIVK